MLEFTEHNFKNEVLEFSGLVLAYFSAPWCGPCQQLSPTLMTLAQTNSSSQIKIGKINIEQSPTLAQEYNIMSIPSLLFFKNGAVIEQLIGVYPLEALQTKLKELS